jgi:hypothetical protein
LSRFKYEDEKGKYRWQGMKTYSKEKLQELEARNELRWNGKGNPEYKQYLTSLKGISMNNLWSDIFHINPMSNEKLGYPTQKPEALLERIIQTSSNEGEIVADFFCGCGTTIAAAQKLNRQWLGVDISHLAVRLILKRMVEMYGEGVKHNIKLHGFPKDVGSAKMLATDTENGRFGFQEWVIEVLLHGVVNPKKVADGGYDGYMTYETDKSKEFVLIETKSGGVNVKNMREFIQVVEKQKAAAGVFVCFDDTVTREMLKEAKSAGHIKLGMMDTGLDRIQILTIGDLLNGKQPQLPNISSTFKKAQRKESKGSSYGLFD